MQEVIGSTPIFSTESLDRNIRAFLFSAQPERPDHVGKVIGSTPIFSTNDYEGPRNFVGPFLIHCLFLMQVRFCAMRYHPEQSRHLPFKRCYCACLSLNKFMIRPMTTACVSFLLNSDLPSWYLNITLKLDFGISVPMAIE